MDPQFSCDGGQGSEALTLEGRLYIQIVRDESNLRTASNKDNDEVVPIIGHSSLRCSKQTHDLDSPQPGADIIRRGFRILVTVKQQAERKRPHAKGCTYLSQDILLIMTVCDDLDAMLQDQTWHSLKDCADVLLQTVRHHID